MSDAGLLMAVADGIRLAWWPVGVAALVIMVFEYANAAQYSRQHINGHIKNPNDYSNLV
jgi:hypothetical protein